MAGIPTVGRNQLTETARKFMHDVIDTEVEFTHGNNDNGPTSFCDYLADVVTYLERVMQGDVDSEHALRLREFITHEPPPDPSTVKEIP